jgi:hypothetical protein
LRLRVALQLLGAKPLPSRALPQAVLKGFHRKLAMRAGDPAHHPLASNGLRKGATTLQNAQSGGPVFVPTGMPHQCQPKVGLFPFGRQGRPGLGEAFHAPLADHRGNPLPGPNTAGTVGQGPLLAVQEAHGRNSGTDLLQGDPQSSKGPNHRARVQHGLLKGRAREHPPHHCATGGKNGI